MMKEIIVQIVLFSCSGLYMTMYLGYGPWRSILAQVILSALILNLRILFRLAVKEAIEEFIRDTEMLKAKVKAANAEYEYSAAKPDDVYNL
jgi:hypothetical protein